MQRVQAILTSLVTYLVVACTILSIFAQEISDGFTGNHTAEVVVGLIIRTVAIVGTIITIIRRVAPVLPTQRGLILPKDAPRSLFLDK